MVLTVGSVLIIPAGLAAGVVPGTICYFTIAAASRRQRGMTVFEPILVGIVVPTLLGLALRPLMPIETWLFPAQSWSLPAAFFAGGVAAVLAMLIVAGVRRVFIAITT